MSIPQAVTGKRNLEDSFTSEKTPEKANKKQKSTIQIKTDYKFKEIYPILTKLPEEIFNKVNTFLIAKSISHILTTNKDLNKKVDTNILISRIAKENITKNLNGVINLLEKNNYTKLSRYPNEHLGDYIDRCEHQKNAFQNVVHTFFNEASPEFHNKLLRNLCTNHFSLFDLSIQNLPKSITYLDLGFCLYITDKALSSLKPLRNLTHLNLHSCSRISDESVLYDSQKLDDPQYCSHFLDEGASIYLESLSIRYINLIGTWQEFPIPPLTI